jgi:hypothetical protein
VADIEKPGPGADREVLVDDALVFDRHLPAEELDDLGPGFFMEFI